MHIVGRLACVWIFALVGCGASVTPDVGTNETSDTGAPAADSAPSDGAPSDASPADTGSEVSTPISGGDRDAHGCVGSAGYQWCAKEMKCVRPWDLAFEKGFPNTPDAFAKYCGS